uniref:ferroxidase n=1 Tax=Tetraselmis sp. GSL018 TaxID=582737 RepID=A0A061S6R7_9CHLO
MLRSFRINRQRYGCAVHLLETVLKFRSEQLTTIACSGPNAAVKGESFRKFRAAGFTTRLYSDIVDLSEKDYHRVADECMDELHDKIEVFLDDLGDSSYEVEYGMGVLTVKLGDKGTYVINKQTPNRQIWLSSPVSGPFRYDPIHGDWVYRRDSHKLHDKLEAELSELTGAYFRF